MIFEVVDYIAFVLAGITGLRIGLRIKRPDPPVRPICTCDHGYGHHEKGRRCHGAETEWRNGVQHVDPCRCQRYDGPDPAIFGLQEDAA